MELFHQYEKDLLALRHTIEQILQSYKETETRESERLQRHLNDADGLVSQASQENLKAGW
jgi:hypothetical protein